MISDSLDVIRTSMLAGLHPAADAIPSPFASLLSITDIAAAGALAGGFVMSVMAISAVR